MMEASVVLAQLTKARESTFRAGGFGFTMRRPTEMELVKAAVTEDNRVIVNLGLIQDVIIDWSDVKESDVLPGGAGDPLPFDRTVFRAWVADRPDLWGDMIRETQSSINAARQRFEAVAGN